MGYVTEKTVTKKMISLRENEIKGCKRIEII